MTPDEELRGLIPRAAEKRKLLLAAIAESEAELAAMPEGPDKTALQAEVEATKALLVEGQRIVAEAMAVLALAELGQATLVAKAELC